MNNPDNGGPAFPWQLVVNAGSKNPITGNFVPHGQADVHVFEGMSLRDWFAGMAMQGLWSSQLNPGRGYKADAISAYEMADAMLKQRAYPAPPKSHV